MPLVIFRGLWMWCCCFAVDNLSGLSCRQNCVGVLVRKYEADLKIKPSKCNLFSTQLQYLDYVTSGEGVRPDPNKVQSVYEWPVPKAQSEDFLRFGILLQTFCKRFCRDSLPPYISFQRKVGILNGLYLYNAFIQISNGQILVRKHCEIYNTISKDTINNKNNNSNINTDNNTSNII